MAKHSGAEEYNRGKVAGMEESNRSNDEDGSKSVTDHEVSHHVPPPPRLSVAEERTRSGIRIKTRVGEVGATARLYKFLSLARTTQLPQAQHS